MSDLFDEILESILYEEIPNSDEEYNGGLQECEIFYCPYFHVNKFKIPNISASYSSAGTIYESITCKNGIVFEKLSALVDQNELSGDISMNSKKTNLSIYILGLEGSRIGFSRKVSLYPGIYILKDANDRMWIVGNTLSPAFATFTASTGKINEDNSGLQMKLTSNMIFFEYKGEIPKNKKISFFTKEFNFEFD